LQNDNEIEYMGGSKLWYHKGKLYVVDDYTIF